MRELTWVLACGALVVTGCSKSKPPPQESRLTSGPNCGMGLRDWCDAPADDPCGANTNAAACRADARCEGRVYSGESAAPCGVDERCFASKCPTVGCVSRCETLDETHCTAEKERCELHEDKTCTRRHPCGPHAPPAPPCTKDDDCVARNCHCHCDLALATSEPCVEGKCMAEPCTGIVAYCDSTHHCAVTGKGATRCGVDAGPPCPGGSHCVMWKKTAIGYCVPN